MKRRAEIWFHMKKVPIYEDICTRFLYFDMYADLRVRPLGIPIVKSNLA
jgi:hypothetical protein